MCVTTVSITLEKLKSFFYFSYVIYVCVFFNLIFFSFLRHARSPRAWAAEGVNLKD
jgi:hypothetical protein